MILKLQTEDEGYHEGYSIINRRLLLIKLTTQAAPEA